eukprot:CAMPEP_0182906382 /NCGR_PEP_ID=MMETSP0034_2-20130328/33689_1 /TAXON_ID=156128 /ORGANISM="Nephroselmis pyriformis, Strain CCMP717" /LENGTH=42 /DNA_ID= /DNA_START= /DNA_END= /DNA_ORIENTATION=
MLLPEDAEQVLVLDDARVVHNLRAHSEMRDVNPVGIEQLWGP